MTQPDRTRTELTEIEQIRIRHLVEDHAATWYGGPLQLGVLDAIRYTAEAHVEKAFPDVAYETLWDAIRAVLNADITILDRRLTDADRHAAACARTFAAQERLGLAGTAFTEHDYSLAAALVDQAEREDPDGRAPNGQSLYTVARDAISEEFSRRLAEKRASVAEAADRNAAEAADDANENDEGLTATYSRLPMGRDDDAPQAEIGCTDHSPENHPRWGRCARIRRDADHAR